MIDNVSAQARSTTARPQDGGASAASHRADPSVRDLTLQLTADASRLVKAEARLAQLEIQQRAKRAAVGASMFGAAGLAAFLGICCVVAAFILGLANVLQPWFAALITAGLLFLLGLFIVLPGWKGVKDRRPITTDVVGSVKADIETVRRGFPR